MIINEQELKSEISEVFGKIQHPGNDMFEPNGPGEWEMRSFLKWKSWHEIPEKVIKYHYDALSYMNPLGFRFLLPAFMLFGLKHSDDHHISFIVIMFRDIKLENPEKDNSYYLRRIDIFDYQQRKCIVKFFKYVAQEIDTFQPYNAPELALKSLSRYWDVF